LTIALFYLTVVLKKGDVVDGGFQTPDVAEFVVPLPGDRTHQVFDPRALRVQVGSHALGVTAGGQCSLHENAVITRESPRDLIGMPFGK